MQAHRKSGDAESRNHKRAANGSRRVGGQLHRGEAPASPSSIMEGGGKGCRGSSSPASASGTKRALHKQALRVDFPADLIAKKKKTADGNPEIAGSLTWCEGGKTAEGGSIGVLLMHGAGGAAGASEQGHLPALAEAFAMQGWPCVRFDAGPLGVQPERRAMGGWSAIEAASREPACSRISRWVLVGHSNGARVSAQMASEASSEASRPLVLGLVLMSYPVHPPKLEGDRSKWRMMPLIDLQDSILFVRGSKDDMALPGPFEEVRKRVSNCKVCTLDMQGHSLGKESEQVSQPAVEFIRELAASAAQRECGSEHGPAASWIEHEHASEGQQSRRAGKRAGNKRKRGK